MILGIGIDSVDIDKFQYWHTKPRSSLQRIFSGPEIDYCLSNSIKSAERFAIRFAIREAVFKTLTAIDPDHTIPLLTLCKAITVHKTISGMLQLHIKWEIIKPYHNYPSLTQTMWHLSCTHTQTTATAWVIVEKRCVANSHPI